MRLRVTELMPEKHVELVQQFFRDNGTIRYVTPQTNQRRGKTNCERSGTKYRPPRNLAFPYTLFASIRSVFDFLNIITDENAEAKTAREIIKQEIISGSVNDNSIIIKYGVKKGEMLLLSIPENEANIPVSSITDEDKLAYEEELKEEKHKIQKQSLKSNKQ